MHKTILCYLFIFLVINAKSQNEVVFKNMAAALQRDFDKNKGGNSIEQMIWNFDNNSNTNNSIKKLKFNTNVSPDSAKVYLIQNTLQYYFEHYKNDSINNAYYSSINKVEDSICNCLERNQYGGNIELSNTIFSQCLIKYYTASIDEVKIISNYFKSNHTLYNQIKGEAAMVFARFCKYYRNYLINRVVEEALQL